MDGVKTVDHSDLWDFVMAAAGAMAAVYYWQQGWFFCFAFSVTFCLANLIDYACPRETE